MDASTPQKASFAHWLDASMDCCHKTEGNARNLKRVAGINAAAREPAV